MIMLQKWIKAAVWPLAAAVMLTALAAVSRITDADTEAVSEPIPFILIDPGHGGADGGAMGGDGTLEKDINLAIAVPLGDMLRLWGYSVRLTRESDVSIHDSSATTIKQQKVSDMHNRLALYEQAMLTVGIHQNFYPVSKYSGTQLFYATGHPESRVIAEAIRGAVVPLLQPDNTRALKTGADIFLLEKTTRPAVFVECGFLSNPAERDLLKDTVYQRKMALAIMAGICAYGP